MARYLQIGSPETISQSKLFQFPWVVCHSTGKFPKSFGFVVLAVVWAMGRWVWTFAPKELSTELQGQLKL